MQVQQLSLFPTTFNRKSSPAREGTDHQYRKEHGVFYTDMDLATDIIRFLNLPREAVILDPNCGVGRFLLAEKALGYQHVWGCDLDAVATEKCRKETGSPHVYQADTIWDSCQHVLRTISLPEKADAIVGNPPYARLSIYNSPSDTDSNIYQWTKKAGNNLFVASIFQDFNYVKEDGIISLIVPKNLLFVNAYKAMRKYLLQHKTILSIVDLGTVFKDVRGEQILLTLQNREPKGNNIRYYQYQDRKFTPLTQTPQKLFSDVIYIYYHSDDLALYRKLFSIPQRLDQLCTGYIGRGKSEEPDAVAGKDIQKYGFKQRPIPHSGNQVFLQNIYSRESGVIASFGGSLKARPTITVITDGNREKCKYIVGLLQSRLINFFLLKYCYNCSSLTMHTDAKYLRNIPIVTDEATYQTIVQLTETMESTAYLSAQWYDTQKRIDRLVYQTYGISQHEAAYIDQQMQQLQSKKWDYERQPR